MNEQTRTEIIDEARRLAREEMQPPGVHINFTVFPFDLQTTVYVTVHPDGTWSWWEPADRKSYVS